MNTAKTHAFVNKLVCKAASLTTLTAALSLSACTQSKDPEQITSVEQSLNGSVVYPLPGCTNVEMQQIINAMMTLDEWVNINPEPLEACVKDAVLSPDHGSHAEEILSRLQEDMPTHFTCASRASNPCNVSADKIDNINACAPFGIATEEMTVMKEFLAANLNTPERVAAVLLHEIAHNKGYTHMSGVEKRYSINEQVEKCIETLEPNGATSTPNGRGRSTMTGEAELQQIGGLAVNGNFMAHCPTGAVAWAQGISETIPGSLFTRVEDLRLYCRHPSGGIAGSMTAGSSTSFNQDFCGENEVIVGVVGTDADGGGISALQFLCGDITALRSGLQSVTNSLDRVGGIVGTSVSRLCPPGMAVKGMMGNVDTDLEQLRLVCQDLRWSDIAPPELATSIGTMSMQIQRITQEVCSDRGVMVGLFGRESNNMTTHLSRIGGICQGVKRAFPANAAPLAIENGEEHIVPGAGALDGAEFDRRCNEGEALIGVRMSRDAMTGALASVVGICKPIADWDAVGGVVPPDSLLAVAGIETPLVEQSRCARGQFLVGLKVRSSVSGLTGEIVPERVTPLCRSFQSTGNFGTNPLYR